MSESIALEFYCIGLSRTIKAQTFGITRAKLGPDFLALIPHEYQTESGALERIRTSDLYLRGATLINSQLIYKQASIDDAQQ